MEHDSLRTLHVQLGSDDMTEDSGLKKLIEAKKAADQDKLDARETARQEGLVRAEKRRSADQDWSDFLALVNDEAGRINSVKADTGVTIHGVSRNEMVQGRPIVGYRFITTGSSAQALVIFTRHEDDRVHTTFTPQNTRNIEFLNFTVEQEPSLPKKVTVRDIFEKVVTALVKT